MKIKIKTAIISVSDKNNLKIILAALKKFKVKIISSGGTYKKIKKLGYDCLEISNFTNSPEVLDGRVKTLHPKIYSGILNKINNKTHKYEMKKLGYENIDLIVTNFYPFEQTLSLSKKHENIIENIDVGGPTMVRAAAKNYHYKTVITSIKQYNDLKNELNTNNGYTSLNFRKKLSAKGFLETAYYDAVISNYFLKLTETKFPHKKIIFGKKSKKLRYGENPHQEACLYTNSENYFNQISGKQISYNNYNDLFTAIKITKTFPKNVGCVIVKHTNPCGASMDKNKLNSIKNAIRCDPISAFGGVVSCNFKIDNTIAKKFNKLFLEIIIGNGFTNDAIRTLKKRKNLIIIDAKNFKLEKNQKFLSNFSSFLVQDDDINYFKSDNFKVVSKKRPSRQTLKDLIFSFNICRFVKSNSIVISSNLSTIGIGSGQSSRVDSCEIAINKMRKFKLNYRDEIKCAASDAFFPFTDGVEKLAISGIQAIVQPSGSIRDKEIIKFANKIGLILVFSKTRHFNH